MPALTPEMAGTSVIVSLVMLVIAIGFNAIMLYLNYKQAKVKNRMDELVDIAKEIRDLLKKKK